MARYRRVYVGNGEFDSEHRLVAKSVIPEYSGYYEVHHVDGDPENNAKNNLVICPSRSYHRLLHSRLRVKRAGGDPNKDRICSSCGLVLPIESFGAKETECRACGSKASMRRYRERKALKEPTTAECPECGESFVVGRARRFCGNKCRLAWWGREQERQRKINGRPRRRAAA